MPINIIALKVELVTRPLFEDSSRGIRDASPSSGPRELVFLAHERDGSVFKR